MGDQRLGRRIARRLLRPVDISSLVALRVLYGALAFWASLRFLLYGWVERFYIAPGDHFSFWGLEWIEAPAPWVMYASFVVMTLLGLLIMVGCYSRAACVVFVLLFSYVELIDVAMYLNHYYLFGLLGLLLALTPAHRAWSVDAWRKPQLRAGSAPAWSVYLLRAQVGCVYTFAALAKAQSDWLFHGQPLNIWMIARSELPVLGGLLSYWESALVMSWAGFLFDLTIIYWLSWRKSRPVAYLVVIAFHILTGQLFAIGMFPWIMMVAATIFFDPGWARAILPRAGAVEESLLTPRLPARREKLMAGGLALYLLVQLLLPLRCHLYGGDVLWHEQGMRWSWRVMVREKNGAVSYKLRLPDGRQQWVEPSRYLTDHQEREMSGQPDLIVQLGQHIGRQARARHGAPVEVYVDARVSLNGRPAAVLIDPGVDLMTIDDGLLAADWILAAPSGPPPHLRSLRTARGVSR